MDATFFINTFLSANWAFFIKKTFSNRYSEHIGQFDALLQ
ncbi:hypothetical protein BN1221_03013 [Brenneria goodwinii]|uniref:Uncharacterized protein n=1 Tax=Brenneria goodwinii TaxID=1109412 RepID=A0A0G4JX98_9GAMM|nr:hypothetical protein BN1221_03013 [Brenneria goodwinii]